jgi:glycosyltransferase involved in cell wall biosynthesis/phospholipid N-methyltransferase
LLRYYGPVKLSVVMPVYNERFLITEIVKKVLAFSDPRISELELVIVDDGSSDGTREVLKELQDELPQIRLLLQPENRGKGAAVRAGIDVVTGDLTVIQDADLEYNPEDWGRMLTPFFEAGADAVYGSRFLPAGYRRVLYFRHTIGNRLLTLVSNLATDLNLTDMETCYKMVRTELLRSIPIRSSDFSMEPEITAKLAKRGARIYEVPIRYAGRTYQEGKKIRFRHAVTAMLAILKWRLIDDLYSGEDERGAEILASLSQVPAFNRWMGDFIRPWVGNRVLEIGAGIGNLTMQLMPRSRYLATDVNPHYLSYLTNLTYGRPYLETCRVDLAEPQDFEPLAGSFDTVICLNVLEHVAQEATAIANLRSALRPGGQAIVLVPQGQSRYSSLDRVLGHVKRYAADELQTALAERGLEVVALRQFNRTGVPGWLLNGKLLRRKRFSRLQLKLFNILMPVVRRTDRLLPWRGLSLVAIARR